MKFPFPKKNETGDMPDKRELYEDDGFYRGDEDEDGVIDDASFADDKAKETVAAPKRKATGGAAGGKMMKVIKAKSSEDGRDIADYLKEGYNVVLNVEEIERTELFRLIDFLMGALYVLGGEMNRVAQKTLVLSPRQGEMSFEEDAD